MSAQRHRVKWLDGPRSQIPRPIAIRFGTTYTDPQMMSVERRTSGLRTKTALARGFISHPTTSVLLRSSVLQGFGLILTMFVGVQLARQLTPAEFGSYGLVLSAVAIVGVIGQFGLPLLAMREAAALIASSFGSGLSLVGWFLRVTVVVSAGVALATVAVFACIPARLSPFSVDFAFTGAALVVTFAIIAVGGGLLKGLQWPIAGQSPDLVIRPALFSLSLAVFALVDRPLDAGGALALHFAAATLTVLITIAILLAVAKSLPGTPTQFRQRPWVATARSFMLSGIMQALNANYPMIVAGIFVSRYDVGILRVALSSATLVGLPLATTNIAAAPLIARLHAQDDRAGLAKLLAWVTLSGFAITTVLLGSLFFCGEWLIAHLFGAAYRSAWGPLMVLGLAQLVVSAFGIAGTYLNMVGQERLVSRSFVTAVPTGILLSIPLTHYYGINGAALGNLSMVALWHALVVVAARKRSLLGLSVLSAWRNLRTDAAPHEGDL